MSQFSVTAAISNMSGVMCYNNLDIIVPCGLFSVNRAFRVITVLERKSRLSDQMEPAVSGGHEPDLPPVIREMLHEQIFTVLKRNLMVGRFAPGQKLPLRGLARTLGTSLMPVRDALQRLESVGCVVSTANRTMMVPVFTNKELLDICTLRTLLEGATAERAAIERTDAELETLLHHCNQIEKSADTHDL